MIKHCRPILGSLVSALLILAGWIVKLPEPSKNIRGRDLLGIKHHLDNFDMAGVLLADLLIGRVWDKSAHVARHHGMNTLQLLVDCFHAPEAPGTE